MPGCKVINGQIAPGSRAEEIAHARTGRIIAPGFKPTPEHDLIFHGGKTIHDLTFTNFFVGGDSAWSQSDIDSIDTALADAMSDPDLNNVMEQFFHNQPITSIFRPSSILPGAAPAQLSQGDAENLVMQLHSDGLLANFDLSSTVFNLMLPRGTILTDDPNPTRGQAAKSVYHGVQISVLEENSSSLEGLGGFHGSVHIGNATVYYAIGVFSEQLPDGTVNGIPVFDQSWKNIVATFYHELNEARTDADIGDAIRAGNSPTANKFLGWVSAQGEECGDFPVFEAHPLSKVFKEVPLTNGGGTVPIQFLYSNAVHGPEGPISQLHGSVSLQNGYRDMATPTKRSGSVGNVSGLSRK